MAIEIADLPIKNGVLFIFMLVYQRVPPNGWFKGENPMNIDGWMGYPNLWKPPIITSEILYLNGQHPLNLSKTGPLPVASF